MPEKTIGSRNMNTMRYTISLLKRTLPLGMGMLLLMLWSFGLTAQEEQKERVYTNREDNEKCLKCHGSYKFKFQFEEKDYRFKMPADYVIDTAAYAISNHWNFKCIDCHTDEYLVAPHDQTLRFQSIATCMDCHGGDEVYAKYNFEKIEAEFQESVHSSRHGEDFSCWSCHDAHTYKINARNKDQEITKTVAYDNAICLSCHADYTKYQLIRDTLNPNVIAKHDWLPNQLNHFQKVRCIECHTEVSDSTMVAHKVRPKKFAVKNCVECHSTNSLLQKTLFRFQVEESRKTKGFFNASMLSDLYVVGANRNIYLNYASAGIFFLVLLAIGIHIFFRIKR